MRKFEYKQVFEHRAIPLETLNKLGAEGWELVAVAGYVWIFKREV